MLSATWFKGLSRSLKFFGRRWQIISCLQHILLRNDDSTIALPFYQKKVFLSGVTAAKKTLVSRWKPPHTLIHKWIYLISSCFSFRIVECRHKWREKQSIEDGKVLWKKLKHIYSITSSTSMYLKPWQVYTEFLFILIFNL